MNVPGGVPSPAGAPRSRFRFQPQVEILEDRLAPSGVALAAFPSLLSLASLYSGENPGSGGTNTIAVTTPASQASSSSAPPAAAGTAAETLGYVLTNMADSAVREQAPGRSAAGTIVVAIPNGQAPPANESGMQTRIVTAGVSSDATAAGTQTETISLNTMSLNVAAARPTRGVSGALPSTLEAPRTAETTMYVNGVSAGQVGTPPNGNTPSSAGVQIAAPSVQSNFAPPTAGSVAPIHSAGAAGTQAPEIALQANPIQVGVSGTSSGAMASSSVTAQLVSATGTDSSSAGEKDTGLTASAAAQRKALALGLRYLYPEITDDEIAQAAGVSRRTLFRWEEYVTIKKALRILYKRPRGFKDREGNLEAWFEEGD